MRKAAAAAILFLCGGCLIATCKGACETWAQFGFLGIIVNTLLVEDAAECCSFCEADGACVAWTLEGESSCKLFSRVDNIRHDETALSGMNDGTCVRNVG